MPLENQIEQSLDRAEISDHILKSLNIAYALVDQNLIILTHTLAFKKWITLPLAGQPEEVSASLKGQVLPELFPELIGIETSLLELLQHPGKSFNLPRIYRPVPQQSGYYFNLQIEAAPGPEPAFLVLISDVTEQGHLEQVLVQQRNELSLNIAGRKRMEQALQESLSQVERAKQEWETTADSLADLVCLLDREGRIIRANRTLERWDLGHVHEIKGQPIQHLLHPEWASFWQQGKAALAQGQSVEAEGWDERLERHLYVRLHPIVAAANHPLDASSSSFAALVISDVTERKQAEVELRRAKDAAEAANRAKSIFLAGMSHELRTPLSVIIGYAEMLKEESERRDQAGFLLDSATIHQAGLHLLALIDNVISLSKIEAGEWEIHSDIFDIATLINNLTAYMQPLLDMRSNRLEARYDRELGSMHTDQALIRQVLFNLLSNANKLSQDAIITLTIERVEAEEGERRKDEGGRMKNSSKDYPFILHEKRSSFILFEVSDTAVSITEEQMQQIFDTFGQGDTSAMRRHGDVGLSLAISRRICQLMGGDLMLENGAGPGSTFVVRLPGYLSHEAARLVPIAETLPQPRQPLPIGQSAALAPVQPLLKQESPAVNPALLMKEATPSDSPATILIVDDNQDIRRMLSLRLKQGGYNFVTAENGRQGLELIQSQPFDLVITDIMMPEMNGYQLLERLKADPALRHIPVIVISAVDNLESVIKCIEMGAEDYLFKPFNNILLSARVAASLEKKMLRDHEQAYLHQIQVEQEKSERLLLNVLPRPIAERLKKGQEAIVDNFPEVTILFADIVGFTHLSARISPLELMAMLNEIFSTFDHLAEVCGLEKIKTIGDSYMVVGGLPIPRPDHAEAIAAMALEMQSALVRLNQHWPEPLDLRIGINTGPVVAGVIGSKKFSYDLWGDAVNTASRMESQGVVGQIQLSADTYFHLKEKYLCQPRGHIEIKGKGQMMTYFLLSRK